MRISCAAPPDSEQRSRRLKVLRKSLETKQFSAHLPGLPDNPAIHYTLETIRGDRIGLSATLPVISFPVEIKLHKC